jgi:hypothetical protein
MDFSRYRNARVPALLRSFTAILLCATALTTNAFGWGSTGHQIINRNAVIHLPASLKQLADQQAFLIAHASDADNRKSKDTSEYPKHFIDIERYPEMLSLPDSYTPLVTKYGWTTVKDIGILPWAITAAVDSMTAQMRRGSWSAAYQSAADLGHYVGDAHQPLHCTQNYDGQMTGNTGIHSNYETAMLGAKASLLMFTVDSARYVNNPFQFAMQIILHSNSVVDSILHADTYARATTGYSGGKTTTAYTDSLWSRVGGLTQDLLQQATVNLASLWYTAWVNAGISTTAIAENHALHPTDIVLDQNYPNPANPTTRISYTIGRVVAPSASEGRASTVSAVGAGSGLQVAGSGKTAGSGLQVAGSEVQLTVYDLLGRKVAVLVDGVQSPGRHEVVFDARNLASGVYVYRMTAGPFSASKKLTIVR